MIIISQELLEENNLDNLISQEKELISANIKIQNKIKEMLLDYMQKFIDSPDNINLSNSNSIIKLVEDYSISLQYHSANIKSLNECLNELDIVKTKLSADNSKLDLDVIDNFNTKYMEVNKSVNEKTLHIMSFLQSVLSYSEFNFTENTEQDEIANLKIENNNINSVDSLSRTRKWIYKDRICWGRKQVKWNYRGK